MHGEEAPQSKEAQLQAALDAEREKVKRLSTCGTDHSTPWWQVKCEGLEAQLATLQAQLADRDAMILQMGEQAAVLAKENMAVKAQLREVEGERDHAKKMEAVQKEVADNQTWHVQKLKGWRDTVTLALQRPGGARFEDVPGHIKALVKEHDTLRQLVEALPVVDVQEVSVWLSPDESGWLVSKRPAFPAGLYWAKFRTQDEADSFRALLAYRATLAAQDAGEGSNASAK